MKVSTIRMNLKLQKTDEFEKLIDKAKKLNDELRETIAEINSCELEITVGEVGTRGGKQ